ncbi:hypothetical protein DL96DRAFT_1720561 [Flagelloscypha sp. PMI_526]|nr:hypothetical protein DL96DRAFT_1720561 [Flagelloscypha sp. PMI_526]
MFLQFTRLPSELQEYIVYWATGTYDDPDSSEGLTLVSKDIFVWATRNRYRILVIETISHLKCLLQTEYIWPTAAQHVHVLVLSDIPASDSTIIHEMLTMTSNLISLLFNIEGGFTVPESIFLPKLRAAIAASSEPTTNTVCYLRLPPVLIQQLTHFTYVLYATGLEKWDDLLWWLSQPLDSITHFRLVFDEDCADDLEQWQILFRETRDTVLPLLPSHLRVFLVQPEYIPDESSLGDDMLNFLDGQIDSRVVFAPSEDGQNSSLHPMFLEYEGERVRESLHIYEADAKGIWVLAEEFIGARAHRLQARI